MNSLPTDTLQHDVFRPRTDREVADFLSQTTGLVAVRGGHTKPALIAGPSYRWLLHTDRLTGITDYQPSEFMISAQAGTKLETINAELQAAGQYLPFDPPWIDDGATLGGAVASGLSGPTRLLYGGLRDFVLGIRFVDGLGKIVTGGAKVVKNAAGFDLPKMMVGSCGRLGVLLEVTLKVFPRPKTYRTVRFIGISLEKACQLQTDIMKMGIGVAAIDLLPGADLWVRLAGPEEATRHTSERLLNGYSNAELVPQSPEELQLWDNARDARWLPADHALVKVPLSPSTIVVLEKALARYALLHRYSGAGNVAWISWPIASPLAALDQLLFGLNLSGLVVRGTECYRRLGVDHAVRLSQRIQHAIDPLRRFAG